GVVQVHLGNQLPDEVPGFPLFGISPEAGGRCEDDALALLLSLDGFLPIKPCMPRLLCDVFTARFLLGKGRLRGNRRGQYEHRKQQPDHSEPPFHLFLFSALQRPQAMLTPSSRAPPQQWWTPSEECKLTLGRSNMARRRRTYTPEFKAEAVKLVTEQGYSVAEAARSLGIHETLLRSWKQALDAQGDQAFPGHGKPPPFADEMRRLHADNQRLRAARAILKKATALFAREAL